MTKTIAKKIFDAAYAVYTDMGTKAHKALLRKHGAAGRSNVELACTALAALDSMPAKPGMSWLDCCGKGWIRSTTKRHPKRLPAIIKRYSGELDAHTDYVKYVLPRRRGKAA
jgi:hypothetical protein